MTEEQKDLAAQLKLKQKVEAMAALRSGNSPLEYMLRVMRNPNTKQERRDKMAMAAAPYCHPRLSTHELSGVGGGAIPVGIQATVTFYVPDNGRQVAPAAPANDAVASKLVAVLKGNGKGNGHGGNGSGVKTA